MSTDSNLITPQSHMEGEIKKRPKYGGRKKGSKNRTTLLNVAIRDEFIKLAKMESRKVFKVLAEKAKEGDPAMIKLFLDKVIPNAQHDNEVKRGDFGINIVISDMRTEEKSIEGEIINDNPEL